MDSTQLSQYRTVLFRYALLQLHDSAIADDVVQETLLAALQSGDNFRHASQTRTWLIGILKHKIIDYHRIQERFHVLEDSGDEDRTDPHEAIEQLIFDGKGHWIGKPSAWNEPDHALEQDEFWLIFDLCQKNLPEQQARIFMLREMVGLEADEICQDMDISPSACRVYLHRARLRLRECLEQRWFNNTKEYEKL